MKKLIVLTAISFLFNIYTWAQDEVCDSIGGAPEEQQVPMVVSNIMCEDTCSHIHGIDMSHYQGNVFWQTIGEHTNMAYVYLKATEGGDRIDATFERNIEMAHKYGLKVGSYHFYRPLADQMRQLKNFMSQCLPEEQDLIPMIDIESTGGLDTDVFCDSLFYFLDLVEEAYHQKPLLYTGRNFYNKHLQGKVDDYKIMIAMYTNQEPVVADDRDITMWQYTGKGRIMGVNFFSPISMPNTGGIIRRRTNGDVFD